jgi:hypothetical protein
MGQAIGDSITFAVGIAISPVPIIAVILMLLSTKSRCRILIGADLCPSESVGATAAFLLRLSR